MHMHVSCSTHPYLAAYILDWTLGLVPSYNLWFGWNCTLETWRCNRTLAVWGGSIKSFVQSSLCTVLSWALYNYNSQAIYLLGNSYDTSGKGRERERNGQLHRCFKIWLLLLKEEEGIRRRRGGDQQGFGLSLLSHGNHKKQDNVNSRIGLE